MAQRKLSWDDLFNVLVVGRTGSLAAAARELRVNHSTMFRRIGAIEDRLGVRLFDRRRDGYVPTPAGEAVVTFASGVDEGAIALERRLAGQDLRPSGTVRFTTTDTLAPMLVPLCGRFQRAYPEISLEIVTGTQLLNLSRRDADVALRPSPTPPEHLHGRRIASVRFAIYEAADANEDGVGIEQRSWIGMDDSLSHVSAYAWLRDNVDSSRVTLRASSVNTVRDAAKAGLGLALLPCYIGDAEPALRRVGGIVESVSTDLWLLVHDDIRRTARVRAFMDFLHAALVDRRPLFEGA